MSVNTDETQAESSNRTVKDDNNSLSVTILNDPPIESSDITKNKRHCRYLKLDGYCRDGENCKFLHTGKERENTLQRESEIVEDKSKVVDSNIQNKSQVKVCSYFKKFGSCKYNENCYYLHENKIENVINGVEENQELVFTNNSDQQQNTVSSDTNLNIDSPSKRKCKYFRSQSGCKLGDKCSFVHYRSVNDAGEIRDNIEDKILIRETDLENDIKGDQQHVNVENKSDRNSKYIHRRCRYFRNGKCKSGIECQFSHDIIVKGSSISNTNNEKTPKLVPDVKEQVYNEKESSLKVCPYFIKGYCKFRTKCKDLHPTLNGIGDEKSKIRKIRRCRYDNVGCGNENCKYRHDNPTFSNNGESHLTESQFLRQTEIQQLQKRFRGEKCVIVAEGPPTNFIVTFEPTDPDWGFVVKSFNLNVSFPEEYPRKMFEIHVEEQDNFPGSFAKFLNDDLQKWQHNTAAIRTENDLSFRPFLKWFDKNISAMFMSAAMMVKMQIDAENAGIMLIPHAEILQNKTTDSNDDALHDDTSAADQDDEKPGETMTTTEANKLMSASQNSENQETKTSSLSKQSSENIKKGTEMKLIGTLHKDVGTLKLQQIELVVECMRCKNISDFKLFDKRAYASFCEKCNQHEGVTYHAVLIHHYSPVAGYLHMTGCRAIALTLITSSLVTNCMECSEDTVTKGVSFAETKDIYCQHCHKKMDVNFEAAKFYYMQAGEVSNSKVATSIPKKKVLRDPNIKDGESLPDSGICKHYKKSFRWLRFPCCGKAYPCDTCHDTKEDHVFEYAVKMICGHCSKEQTYSSDKPCVRCSCDLTKQRSTHWEGGKGCRDRVAMSRNDSHKTAGINKTISRKKAALNKPKEKKSAEKKT